MIDEKEMEISQGQAQERQREDVRKGKESRKDTTHRSETFALTQAGGDVRSVKAQEKKLK